MDKKYYTPSIEEFHIGFEFECIEPVNLSKDWVHHIITHLDELVDYIGYYTHKSNHFRIKYLDREDIESLGFKFKCQERYEEIYELIVNPDYSIFLHKYHNILQIRKVEPGDDNLVFHGNIKNKSELKKLLTQLEIDYEK